MMMTQNVNKNSFGGVMYYSQGKQSDAAVETIPVYKLLRILQVKS